MRIGRVDRASRRRRRNLALLLKKRKREWNRGRVRRILVDYRNRRRDRKEVRVDESISRSNVSRFEVRRVDHVVL